MKKFVKWFGIIAIVMIIGFLFTTCKKDSLDGTTWRGNDHGEEFVLEFKNQNFTLTVDDNKYVLEGSYIISGNTVTMVMKDDDLSFTGPLVGNTLLLSDSEGDGTIRFTRQ